MRANTSLVTMPSGKALLIIFSLVAIWINISEIFRYFVFIMPMMRGAFPQITNIAPMNLGVFALWGVWDLILVLCTTGIAWICLLFFGKSTKKVIVIASFIWLGIFGIFWLGMWNLGLATSEMLIVAWPLSWLEVLIAVVIVRWGLQNFTIAFKSE